MSFLPQKQSQRFCVVLSVFHKSLLILGYVRPSVPSPNRSVSAALMCSSWPLPSSFYVCVSFKTSSSLESSLYTTPSYICMCSLPFPLICDCSSGFYFFVLVFILESLALGHSYISSELLSNLRYLSYFALCFLPWL